VKEKEESESDSFSVVCLVDPGQYRHIDETLRHETSGKGRLELIDLKEVKDNEEELGES
jgi:ribosome maturation protein SDO1